MTANLSGRSPEFYNYLEGLKVKTHAVKEPITDNRLYVEVEPQPDEDTDETFFEQDSLCYVDSDGKITHDITPPILVGDTVYQGEEWQDLSQYFKEEAEPYHILKSSWPDGPIKEDWQSPETMPIELGCIEFFVVFPHGFSVPVMTTLYPTTALYFNSPPVFPVKIKSPSSIRVELVFPYWCRQSKGFNLKRK